MHWAGGMLPRRDCPAMFRWTTVRVRRRLAAPSCEANDYGYNSGRQQETVFRFRDAKGHLAVFRSTQF